MSCVLVSGVVSAVDVVCVGECCSCRIGGSDVLLCISRFSRKYRQCNGENRKFKGKFIMSKCGHHILNLSAISFTII